MRLRNREWVCGSIVAALLVFGPIALRAQATGVKTFPTYREAAKAFVEAVKANDNAALKEILGPTEVDMLSSGDATQDENDRQSFLKHYAQAHAFARETADKVTLTVGSAAWPLPFPIVRENGAWHFDAEAGARELMYRRIGNNELDAIRVVLALRAAQKEYAAAEHDGNPVGTYAQRFRSTPGKQDGLYWETSDDEQTSPAGSLMAEAESEGGGQAGKRTPFHGYYYRILKAQGPHAPGGAKDYVKDGQMTGGFAIVAYPAEYKASGVMTFMVGPRATVYQKDLGNDTTETVRAMTAFDPDSSWKVVH
ncbi:MAG TPA: DUF2950 domain-containing protein [Alloacidobacterium sp.]|jgi:hypothetical protein|nr:DUF2950 domain-containing protein [Alloacidobacterium sp.]